MRILIQIGAVALFETVFRVEPVAGLETPISECEIEQIGFPHRLLDACGNQIAPPGVFENQICSVFARDDRLFRSCGIDHRGQPGERTQKSVSAPVPVAGSAGDRVQNVVCSGALRVVQFAVGAVGRDDSPESERTGKGGHLLQIVPVEFIHEFQTVGDHRIVEFLLSERGLGDPEIVQFDFEFGRVAAPLLDIPARREIQILQRLRAFSRNEVRRKRREIPALFQRFRVSVFLLQKRRPAVMKDFPCRRRQFPPVGRIVHLEGGDIRAFVFDLIDQQSRIFRRREIVPVRIRGPQNHPDDLLLPPDRLRMEKADVGVIAPVGAQIAEETVVMPERERKIESVPVARGDQLLQIRQKVRREFQRIDGQKRHPVIVLIHRPCPRERRDHVADRGISHRLDPFQETVQRISAEAVLLGKIIQIAGSEIASPDLRELPAVFKPEYRSLGRERPVAINLQLPREGGEIGIGDFRVRETCQRIARDRLLRKNRIPHSPDKDPLLPQRVQFLRKTGLNGRTKILRKKQLGK